MASGLARIERFIADAGYARAPWLVVAFGCGIAAWFLLPHPSQWLALICAALGIAGLTLVAMAPAGRYPFLRQAIAGITLMLAAGCGTVWVKSALAGTPALPRPVVRELVGAVLSRDEQPAEGRTRLVIATRVQEMPGQVVNVRVNVPVQFDLADASESALVRLRARLVPPAAPMLPGGYDFARAAWFSRLSATGTALAPIAVVHPAADGGGGFARLRHFLSAHVRQRLAGSAGGIAAAFASGDRGGIAEPDEQAMRDSGLTHLLSVSGLHVSAVIGGVYFVAIRLLALSPWLALRLRLPLCAAGMAAGTGVFYTLLTGAEVPTVRSVLGALLVLMAVALGREALSLRTLAVAGFLVLLFWPEAVIGPSFQLSFGAVMTIVALHATAPMRRLTAARDDTWWGWSLRHLASLMITGIAIELALMPIGLFHFHRAGIYGSLANVIAIPLTTVVTMPLIALSLTLDIFGAGAPAWWATGQSLDALLWLARLVADQPGAVTMVPTMDRAAFALFVAGGLWLALWQKRVRLCGLLPVAVGTIWLFLLKPADILISGDGRHVAFPTLSSDALVLLRDSRSSFARENLAESAGISAARIVPLADWPQARCNDEFCALEMERGGRTWRLLLARGTERVPLRDLAAACERADIVIADRRLPWSCRPRAIKADRAMLGQTGGLAIDLARFRVTTVAQSQGQHGWWNPAEPFRPVPVSAAPTTTGAPETGAPVNVQ